MFSGFRVGVLPATQRPMERETGCTVSELSLSMFLSTLFQFLNFFELETRASEKQKAGEILHPPAIVKDVTHPGFCVCVCVCMCKCAPLGLNSGPLH